MAKQPDKKTSPEVANEASKILKDTQATGEAKSVAASDHGQAGKPDRQTSPKVATEESKILKDAEASPPEKSVAASDLSQAGGKKK